MRDLHNIDLNLLVVLEALLRERNLTRAGQRLCISQPAVSGSLKRLRKLLGDELLVRHGNEMALTPRAMALLPQVTLALSDVRTVFADNEAFDPASAQAQLRMATTDHVLSLLLPTLLPMWAQEMPNVDFAITHFRGLGEEQQLMSNDIDLVIASYLPISPHVRHRVLWTERLVCIVRAGHPALAGTESGPIPIDRYLAYPHLRLSSHARHLGEMATAMAGLPVQRRIAWQVPDASVLPGMLERSDLIALVSERLADQFASQYELVLRPTPVALPPLTTEMMWHERLDRVPVQAWVRNSIERACAPLRAGQHDDTASDASEIRQ